jgi:rare lipoprotein A
MPPDKRPVFYGVASWYAMGERTANGERFHPLGMTAADTGAWPFGTMLEVENLANGKRVVVRVTDRGLLPGRILDLSLGAAKELDMIGVGLAEVRIREGR